MGIYVQKKRVQGYHLIKNTIIVGDSDNKGMSKQFKRLFIIPMIERHISVFQNNSRVAERPIRRGKMFPYSTISGVFFNSGGPSHLKNVSFHGLETIDRYRFVAREKKILQQKSLPLPSFFLSIFNFKFQKFEKLPSFYSTGKAIWLEEQYFFPNGVTSSTE